MEKRVIELTPALSINQRRRCGLLKEWWIDFPAQQGGNMLGGEAGGWPDFVFGPVEVETISFHVCGVDFLNRGGFAFPAGAYDLASLAEMCFCRGENPAEKYVYSPL